MEQKMDKKSKNVASDNAFARFDFDDRLIKVQIFHLKIIFLIKNIF